MNGQFIMQKFTKKIKNYTINFSNLEAQDPTLLPT